MAALTCPHLSLGVTLEVFPQHAGLTRHQTVGQCAVPVRHQRLKYGEHGRQRLHQPSCQVLALCPRCACFPLSFHKHLLGAVSWGSHPTRLGGLANTGNRKDLALGVGDTIPQAAACRAGQALAVEEAFATRLNVADFLRDSLPSSVLFGGYCFDSQAQASSSDRAMCCGGMSAGLLEPQAWRRADWQIDSTMGEAGSDALGCADSELVVFCAGNRCSGTSKPQGNVDRSPVPAPTLSPFRAASIAALAAVVLLILGPSQHGVAMLPLPAPAQAGLWRPPLFESRPSLVAPVPPSSTAIVYSSITNKRLQNPSSTPSVSPRLPILVYDPDELLREPPREEATRKAGDVKTPTDLAESLQKGCGGPQCIAVLFRPSTELEATGFAGVVVLGVVSERRKSGLAQLQDLVRAAQDEKQESEALVASLQQELQLQRSLLSDVLQQRIPLSHIQLDPRVIQARLPEKKPIGSREWMEGIGMRSLEAMGAKKGADVASLAPLPEQPHFPKMGQLHGHEIRTRSLIPEGVSRVVDCTGRALGLAAGPSLEEEIQGEEGGRVNSSVTAEAAAPAMRYVIPDTNQFMTNLPLVKRLRGTTGVQTVVPLAVLSELDGLQNHSNKRIGSLARRALRYLQQEMKSGVTWLRGQRRSEVRCLVGVDPAKRHGPAGGVRSPREGWSQTTYSQDDPAIAADDALVDCCIHFLEGGSEVTLLTEDKTLQLKAMFHAVTSVSIRDFLEQPSGDPVALPERIDTEVALDQLRRYESTATVRSPKRAAVRNPRKERADRRPPVDQHGFANDSDAQPQPLDDKMGGDSRADGPAENGHTEGVSHSHRDASGAAGVGAHVDSDPRGGGARRSEAGSGSGRGRKEDLGPEIGARQSGHAAERGTDSECPSSSRSGQTRGGRGREKGGQAQGENGAGERAKTGRGRATTSGRRRQEGRAKPGEDGGSEGEGRGTRKGNARNKTQGRQPRFAQTKAGKDSDQARSVVRDLADMLDLHAREGVSKGQSEKAGNSRESGRSLQRPP